MDQDDPYERPFKKPLEKLEKDVKATVRYPSKDERFGSVSMGWRLPGELWEVIPTIQVPCLTLAATFGTTTLRATLRRGVECRPAECHPAECRLF